MALTFHPRLPDIEAAIKRRRETGYQLSVDDEDPNDDTSATNSSNEQQADTSGVLSSDNSTDTGDIEQNTSITPDTDNVQETTNEDTYFIKLDSRDRYNAIRQLDSDPEWSKYLRTYAGRRIKRDAESDIALLRAERDAAIAERDAERAKAEIGLILQNEGEDGIARRLATDKEFAAKYHSLKEEIPNNIDNVRGQVTVRKQVEALFQQGLENGITPERLEEWEYYLRNGWFDYTRDQNGNPVGGKLSSLESFSLFQRSFLSEIQNKKLTQVSEMAAKAVKPLNTMAQNTQQDSTPKINPALERNGPDLSSGESSASTSKVGAISYESYLAMDPPLRYKSYPQGLQRAIEEGRILPPQRR